MIRPLSEILNKRKGVEFLQPLLSESTRESIDFGQKLTSEARSFGIGLKDYLTLAIDPRQSEEHAKFEGLNGYEASLKFLNLPIKNDFNEGIVLEAASDTFQTFPGTRALFPPVIDDMLRFTYRQDQIEQIAPILGNSRTISGVELLSTVVDDAETDYQIAAEIAEGSRIPVKSIRTTEHTVSIFKHGLGYRTTYEFNRRARLDLLTPYAARAMRELERSKLKRAVNLLINGDSVFSAAPVVAQSSYNTAVGSNATNGVLSYRHLLYWLVQRAKAGVPVDTVIGNWDAYFEWISLFSTPVQGQTVDAETLAKAGFQLDTKPLIGGPVKFAVSSDAPASKLVGISKADTLEELVEAGSLIDESERSMNNQTITYYHTENAGYRLVFGDTRSVFNYGA